MPENDRSLRRRCALGTVAVQRGDGIRVELAASPHRDVIFQRMKDAPKPGRLLLLEGYRPERPIYNMDGPSQVEISTSRRCCRASVILSSSTLPNPMRLMEKKLATGHVRPDRSRQTKKSVETGGNPIETIHRCPAGTIHWPLTRSWPGDCQLVFDRRRLLFRDPGLQQVASNIDRTMLTFEAGHRHLNVEAHLLLQLRNTFSLDSQPIFPVMAQGGKWRDIGFRISKPMFESSHRSRARIALQPISRRTFTV